MHYSMHYSLRVTQHQIIKELGVLPTIDVPFEIERRRHFLKYYSRLSSAQVMVLGVSGGIDSTVASVLAQQAARELQQEGFNSRFIAVRLPYGVQRDEDEAQAAIEFIRPDNVLTVNIKPAVDAIMMSLIEGGTANHDPVQFDFIKGNVKARQRMIVQYAIASNNGGIVLGTDHASEALMGFFTKFGDGGADVLPLSGLEKSQVRQVAVGLGVPINLAMKTPTADLEDLFPGKPDESAFGVTYQEIADFLHGKEVLDSVAQSIIVQYTKTAHKRALPVAFC